jgi:hypothetical protein
VEADNIDVVGLLEPNVAVIEPRLSLIVHCAATVAVYPVEHTADLKVIKLLLELAFASEPEHLFDEVHRLLARFDYNPSSDSAGFI